MHSQQVSINVYALAIRKLAAAHQTGEDLSDVKHQVDAVIQAMKEEMAVDKMAQIEMWGELLTILDSCSRNTAHPSWITVINHARYRVKSRKNTAVQYYRQLSA